ncbi:MAG: hypothetical protein J6R43_00935 [Paludibacteraceae bacterium]|nr:hypothetical protein [Paludibacteraceae bacterium]
MKKILTLAVVLFVISLASVFAQTECKTIAEIKQQADKTKILYTGTAKTTFYNGVYNGLFIEDETGGILLKGYTQNTKANDWVTDSMEVSNITATWSVGSTGSAPGITVASADKKTPTRTSGITITPTRITMSEFFANPATYECRAVVITDAQISPKINGKYYMNNGVDSLYFVPTNLSNYAPAGGEMAGAYVGMQYNRFLLASAEHTKATEFFSFADMAAYYKGRNYEIVDAHIGGALLVNYVTQLDNGKSAIFAQYLGVTGVVNNGLTVFVDGKTNIQAGDSIDGFFGKYTDSYKHASDKTNFTGASFAQVSTTALNVRSSGNAVDVVDDVNISDLTSSTLALNYSAQIIASRYRGNLYFLDGQYYYKVAYEISNPSEDEEDGMIVVSDSIRVVGAEGVDMSTLCGSNVILSGVYDACVIYPDAPTIIVRNANDVLMSSKEYDNIAQLINAGEPLSSEVVYGLKNEVIVNYKRTQKNSGTSQTWVFVEDESGVLALDFGEANVTLKVGDKVKGLKGIFRDGYRYGTDLYHAPQLQIAASVIPEVISSDNELNILKTTLKEVIKDTLQYCSHVVEMRNVGGAIESITDLTGSRDDYYLYDGEDPTYRMHYQPALHTGDPIVGENFTIKALVNFNCLDGYYVIYRISISQGSDVAIDDNLSDKVNIYSRNGILWVETTCGQSLEVYTLDGQCLYATANSSNLTEFTDLHGVVIVKINGTSYKTLIK